MRKNVFFKASLTFILCAVVHSARAQLRLVGQLRTRTEYRNGVGTPRPLANDAAIFYFSTHPADLSVSNKPFNFPGIDSGRKSVGTGCIHHQPYRWGPARPS